MIGSRFRFIAALGFVAAALPACATNASRFHDDADAAPAADAGDPQDASRAADAGTPPSFGDGSTAATQCERELRMGAVSISNPACFVNEHVSNVTTKLSFPCAGGSATADFGGHVFKGTVSGDTISLSDVEPFVFNACQWESTESIVGDLSKGTLTYSYRERPVAACTDQPCTAGGSVSVQAGAVVVVK